MSGTIKYKPSVIIYISVILIFFWNGSHAQVASPPTLELGIAEVLGTKGSIDLQILSEIIREKQVELKREFIKKTIFNDLGTQNYTTWEYAYNCFTILLESEDKKSIEKNLLRNSANLAVVYGFSEFYLQISRKLGNHPLYNVYVNFKVDTTKFSQGVLLNQLKEYEFKKHTFSDFFLDLVYDILRSNKTITDDLGFLIDGYALGEGYYKDHSAYQAIRNNQEIVTLRQRIEKEVSFLFKYFILLKNYGDQSLTPVELNEQLKIEVSSIPLDSAGSLRSTLNHHSDNVFSDLQKISTSDVKSELSDKISRNLQAFMSFKKRAEVTQDDLYFIEESLMPLLIELTSSKGFNHKYLMLASQYEQWIASELSNQMLLDLKDADIAHFNQAKLPNYLHVLDFFIRLDQLDKAETYQFVLNTIQTVGDMFKEKKLGFYLSTLTANIQKYSIIDEDKNQISIKVEEIISRIYERYANRDSHILNFYFSIGANQAISSNYNFRTNTLLPDSAGFQIDTLSSWAYAGEKIGLKLKLLDFKKRNSHSPGEKTGNWGLLGCPSTIKTIKSREPLVSDLYLIAYGSGLVYKLVELSSENEFDDPIWGVGLGVAFYNALDLNFTYSRPIRSDNDFFDRFGNQQIFAISVDVKITEYLSRLGNKKKKKEETSESN
ncbi:hypothetical protein [Fulvivirga ligni]|uniref:hypothetical protein n=1 Tax=Fulvivirga ligni TaxID=2904246 RepID=UPI001F296A09|nr:hypothetical protein [Fulvivirga ligni]UII21662.1 hypothetical protein LVD16_00215 [Fulvivirga ligni]